MSQAAASSVRHWSDILTCPVDGSRLKSVEPDGFRCPTCGFEPGRETVGGRPILDFRAVDRPQTRQITVHMPVRPLDRDERMKGWFHAVNQPFDHIPREEIRRRFGTKIDKGIQYYAQKLWRERGADAVILDLGCGSGGNVRYLQTLGFKNILPVDWRSAGADLLLDAHRLPFADQSFDMVFTTAVLEHLYNPFLAMLEISRVLKDDGCLLGGASFWEAWHGSSFFHLTPDGWNSLLSNAGMSLEDLWPGWGIAPAALVHVLTPGRFRAPGYAIQRILEAAYRLALGEQGVRRFQLRASGSFQVFATKSPAGR